MKLDEAVDNLVKVLDKCKVDGELMPTIDDCIEIHKAIAKVAERDNRILVLPNGHTVTGLETALLLLENEKEKAGDQAETYTTGYRNGHRNASIEILKMLLGHPDGTKRKEEAQPGENKERKDEQSQKGG